MAQYYIFIASTLKRARRHTTSSSIIQIHEAKISAEVITTKKIKELKGYSFPLKITSK